MLKMNSDILEGRWKQLRGLVQEKWGKITSDELDQIAGKRSILVGKLQEKYGYTRKLAEEAIDKFLANFR